MDPLALRAEYVVLALSPHAAAQALMWRQWSPDVILFLHTAAAASGVAAAAAINADLTAEDTAAAVAAARAAR